MLAAPPPARRLTTAVLMLAVAVAVNLLLALTIHRLIAFDAPRLAERERVDLGEYVRVPPRHLPTKPPERVPEPEPPERSAQPEPEEIVTSARSVSAPAASQPRIPRPDLGAHLALPATGPGLSELLPTAVGEGGRSTVEVPPLPAPAVRIGPVYPYHARAWRLEGHVVVEFSVGPDGAPHDIRVMESVPPGVFDEAVMGAVRQWRFTIDEQEQTAGRRRRSTIRFRLDER
ncbi:MAG: TonB family protein [Myxococcota bacterium]|nr:TonB family protein [Myxococcota bacterium]